MVCWFCFSRRCCFVCLFTTCHCQVALSILHVRSFLGGILLAFLKIVNLLFPSASWSFPPVRVFYPSCNFCCGKFPVMYSFPLRVYERHGTCPEMLGSPVM